MVLEYFVFGDAYSLSAVAIMPGAVASLVALQKSDSAGYDACVNAITDLVEHVLRFMNNDTSEYIPTEVIKWWCGNMSDRLTVTRQKLQLEFIKGYPQSLICLSRVSSGRQ